MTFSDKIKRAREVAKMTQHDLAQEVGVSQRTIASYESGGARARNLPQKNWRTPSRCP